MKVLGLQTINRTQGDEWIYIDRHAEILDVGTRYGMPYLLLRTETIANQAENRMIVTRMLREQLPQRDDRYIGKYTFENMEYFVFERPAG